MFHRWRVFLGATLALMIFGAWGYATLPDGSEFIRRNPDRTAFMREREAEGIRARQPIDWAPLSSIAPALRYAVIVAEDANFYHHAGIDWDAARQALERDWRDRRWSHGGSTITQQLAKNLYLTQRKTLWRKTIEAAIATRMERRLSKPRMLELYLNVVEWGHGIYGVNAAAHHYFGTDAAGLTIAQAAWLAAILPAPLRYEHRPDAQLVVKRAAIIARFVERRLGGEPQPPPELPPLPTPDDAPEASPESPLPDELPHPPDEFAPAVPPPDVGNDRSVI